MAKKSNYAKRLNRIYREQNYQHMEATLHEANKPKPLATVTSAIREMKLRGFSSFAIEQDLFELGIPYLVDVYSDFNAPVHPLTHYPFWKSKI